MGNGKNKGKSGYILGAIITLTILVIGVLSMVEGRIIFSPRIKILLNDEKNVTVEAFSDYKDAGATAKRGKTDCTDQIVTEGTVNTEKLGEYVITYSVTEKKHTYQAQRHVTVVDTTPPELTLSGETEMMVSSRKLYKEPGYTAMDQYDGDLTEQVTVQEEAGEDSYTLTYHVQDSSGNESTAERRLIIGDVVAPTIKLKGGDRVYLYKGTSYSEEGYTATDDLDGDVTDRVVVKGSVDGDKVGSYTLTYTVTDKAGNTASAERIVSVFSDNVGSSKRLYLTFDDGPSSEVTPRILDILKKNNAKATFFILNYSDANKEIVRRAINEGHTIAIHGYSHDYATIYASDETFMNNVYRLRDKLMADFGYEAKLVRFPGGSSNTISCDYNKGIISRMAKRLEQEGFTYFDWNISSGDAAGNTVSADVIYRNVTKGLFGEGNNVVLMHDTNYKTTTADALQDIIYYAKANGYELLALTPDTKPCHHGIAN